MIKRISYIIISFTLLITTMGLTVNLHYCEGNLYSVAIDSETDNCCEDNNHINHTNNTQNNQFHFEELQNNHCNDKTVLVKIDDYFTTTTENINITDNAIILYTFNSIFNLFTFDLAGISIIDYNNSPPVSRQIFSFIQVFLF